ncbi:fused MFS/spermidine synthase [candidate division WWE3 bacterium]|nr:fused MFS/spermidine synthase [candidate division WWE3 bacterium]
MSLGQIELPKLLYKAPSQINGEIEVYQVGHTRKLSVNNTIQSINWDSPSSMNRVWGRIVEEVKERMPHAKNILMFGLGGGTVFHLFAKKMPGVNLTAVEIDPVMIDVAQKFFDLEQIPNLTIVNDDALRVISEPERYEFKEDTFDVLIVDIFCGDKYPDLGKSGTFFAGIKWFLKDGGLVLFNRIYLEEFQNESDIFVEAVSEVFKNVHIVSIAGRSNSDNILVVGEA